MNTNMLPLGYPFCLRTTLRVETGARIDQQETPSGPAFSFGPLVVAQVQGLFAGNAPVVSLLPQLVVLQGRFVVHRQPLDGVCGKSLRGGGSG